MKPKKGYSGLVLPLFCKCHCRIVILFMLINLLTGNRVSAQDQVLPGVESAGQTAPLLAAISKEGLQIGDTIPNALWNLPLQVINDPKGRKIITLNDYRGKLIILDFWATWCGNCITGLDHLSELQKHFNNEIVVLPLTYEKAEVVQAFLTKSRSSVIQRLKTTFTSIVGQDKFDKVFPHQTIPHTVIIGEDLRIQSITTPEMLTIDNIRGLLSKTSNNYIAVKRERRLEKNLLSLNYTDVKTYGPVYYGTITGYTDGFTGISRTEVDTVAQTQKYTITGAGILKLYSATGFFKNGIAFKPSRRILEVNDPETYVHMDSAMTDQQWATFHSYNYEAVNPARYTSDQIKSKMKADLDFYFDLRGRIESRKVTCLELRVKDPKAIKFKSAGQKRMVVVKGIALGRTPTEEFTAGPSQKGSVNYFRNLLWSDMVGLMNDQLSVFGLLPPVIDQTALDPGMHVDIDLPDDPSDISALQALLKKQGLELVKVERNIDMFVISENTYQSPSSRLILTSYGYLPDSLHSTQR